MEGRNVLLFRAPKCLQDPYDQELRLAGHKPHFVQVLHFQFTNQGRLAASLLNSSPYSGVVFTSQTAAEAALAAVASIVPAPTCLSQCCEILGREEEREGQALVAGEYEPAWRRMLKEQWRLHPVFVVGKATAQAVGRLGLNSSGSCSGNAEELSTVVLQHFKSRDISHVQPLLFPCSSLRRDKLPSVLKEAGLVLEEVQSYVPQPHPDIAASIQRFVDGLLGGDDAVYVVFFSPSGVQFALRELLDICADKLTIKFVAIGKTCAEALAVAGHEVSGVALVPTPRGLTDVINLI